MAIEIANKFGEKVMFKTGRCAVIHSRTECIACGFYGGCPTYYTTKNFSTVSPTMLQRAVAFLTGVYK